MTFWMKSNEIALALSWQLQPTDLSPRFEALTTEASQAVKICEEML